MIKQVGIFNFHAADQGYPYWCWLRMSGEQMVTLSLEDLNDLIYGATAAKHHIEAKLAEDSRLLARDKA